MLLYLRATTFTFYGFRKKVGANDVSGDVGFFADHPRFVPKFDTTEHQLSTGHAESSQGCLRLRI